MTDESWSYTSILLDEDMRGPYDEITTSYKLLDEDMRCSYDEITTSYKLIQSV